MHELGLKIPWVHPPLEPTGAFHSAFHENVIAFLKACGCKIALPPSVRKISAWVVKLHAQESGTSVNLHVYEERVSSDRAPVCEACRNMGEVSPQVLGRTWGTFWVSTLTSNEPVSLPFCSLARSSSLQHELSFHHSRPSGSIWQLNAAPCIC
jgi:hypothetical protein